MVKFLVRMFLSVFFFLLCAKIFEYFHMQQIDTVAENPVI